MGYRPQAKSSKRSRGSQRAKHEKKKTRRKKRRSTSKYLLKENIVPTSEEVVEKTLRRLRSLGSQIFAVSPFRKYFSDWLLGLKSVLKTFESSPSVSIDEQFAKERAHIIASVERALEEGRLKELSLSKAIKNLSDKRARLERIGRDYATGTKEIEKRKKSQIKRLQRNIEGYKKELDDLAKVKAGLFRAVSKKTKSQKKTEATQKLTAAQNKLELTLKNSAAEQKNLGRDYENRKQLVIEQIGKLQKVAANSEVDNSIGARRVACESLANAVKELFQRKMSQRQ